MQWSLLPFADRGLRTKAALLHGRFTGDPSFVYEHTVTHRVGEGENAQEQTTAVSHHNSTKETYTHRPLSRLS